MTGLMHTACDFTDCFSFQFYSPKTSRKIKRRINSNKLLTAMTKGYDFSRSREDKERKKRTIKNDKTLITCWSVQYILG